MIFISIYATRNIKRAKIRYPAIGLIWSFNFLCLSLYGEEVIFEQKVKNISEENIYKVYKYCVFNDDKLSD